MREETKRVLKELGKDTIRWSVRWTIIGGLALGALYLYNRLQEPEGDVSLGDVSLGKRNTSTKFTNYTFPRCKGRTETGWYICDEDDDRRTDYAERVVTATYKDPWRLEKREATREEQEWFLNQD